MRESYNRVIGDYIQLKDEATGELNAWFSVSGDTDDFIFYDAPERILSEK